MPSGSIPNIDKHDLCYLIKCMPSELTILLEIIEQHCLRTLSSLAGLPVSLQAMLVECLKRYLVYLQYEWLGASITS